MAEMMTVHYDATGDILYIDFAPPSFDHLMHEVSEGVLQRLRRGTRQLDGYEIHGFVARSIGNVEFELPAAAARVATSTRS